MTTLRTKLLNDGTAIPIIGFGTATAGSEPGCSEALVLALKKGFRYLDTATGYGNERSVGIALEKWGGRREDVFICSKWGWSKTPKKFDPEAELLASLEAIGVEYLDLYLLHVPNIPRWSRVEAWRKMEDFQRRGLVRSIGVSNFQGEHIEELAKIWTVKPSINQIEFHPYCFHDPRMMKMVETCKTYDIAVSPFSPLCPLRLFAGGPVDGAAQTVGDAKTITAAQVLLAWARQHALDGPIISTASKFWQYGQIIDSAEVRLSAEDMEQIDAAGREGGAKASDTLLGWDADAGAGEAIV